MEHEGPEYIRPEIDKRQHRRATLVAQVRCEALDREEVLLTRDVSVGGMFVSTPKPFPSDAKVSLSFSLRPGDPSLSCHGTVAYPIQGLGMGVQFEDLSEPDRAALQKFVDEAS